MPRRLVPPPPDCDSLSKLNEWLAECGLRQRTDDLAIERGTLLHFARGCEPAPVISVVVNPEMTFREDEGNEVWRTLLHTAAGAIYDQVAEAENKRLVWRVPPEVAEFNVMRHLTNQGDVVDPMTYRGDAAALTAVDIGERTAKFYCRFWLEDV